MKQNIALSLKTILISVTTSIVVVLFIVIASLFYNQNTTISLKVAREFGAVASSNILDELEEYFINAENTLKSLYNIAQTSVFNVNDIQNWYDVMFGLVESDARINALYVADFNGNFYMVKRLPDNSINKRHVYRTDSKIISIWENQNPENKYVFPEYSEASLEEGFDPRKRPWYKNAVAEEITWTEPYIFSSDNILGITGTRRIQLEHFEGVLSVDIGLNYLDTFMTQLQFSNLGSILIRDSKNNLIALHDIFHLYEDKVAISRDLLVTTDKKTFSDEVNQMIVHYEQTKDKVQIAEAKGIIRVLTDIFFSSQKLNNLGSININSNTQTNSFELEGKKYIYTVSNLDLFKGIEWTLMFILEDTTLIGDFNNTIRLGIILLIILFALSLFLYARVSERISSQLLTVSDLMGGIVSLKLDEPYHTNKKNVIHIREIENIGKVYNRVIKSLSSFKRFLPSVVIADSIKRDVEIVQHMDQKQSVSVLFSDIVSFTTITEKFSPLQLSQALGIYFTEMCKVIKEEEGIIDKFIGDAIMGLFGVFDEHMNHAEQACLAALKMQIAHKIVNKKIAEYSDIRFATRIGINTGYALVGILGSAERFNFTALGDTVNITSRLEGLNKNYNTKILISENTKNLLSANFKYKRIDAVQLKGKEEFTTVYQLYAYEKATSPVKQKTIPSFTSQMYNNTKESSVLSNPITNTVNRDDGIQWNKSSDPIDSLLREDELDLQDVITGSYYEDEDTII